MLRLETLVTGSVEEVEPDVRPQINSGGASVSGRRENSKSATPPPPPSPSVESCTTGIDVSTKQETLKKVVVVVNGDINLSLIYQVFTRREAFHTSIIFIRHFVSFSIMCFSFW